MVGDANGPAPTSEKVVSKALRFLSDANPPTLVVCFLLLATVLHTIFGRIGLLIIGAVLGATAHASLEWTEKLDEPTVRTYTRKRETGLDIATRLFDWQEKNLLKGQRDKDTVAPKPDRSTEARLGPASTAALEELESAILQGYIQLSLCNSFI